MKNLFMITAMCICSIALAQKNSQNKDELLKADAEIVMEEITFMYDYDQALREYTLFKTFDKHKTDSIENLSPELLRNHIKEHNFKSDSLSKKLNRDYIVHFDDMHTTRIIELTKKYGFPSKERLERLSSKSFPEEVNPYILLVHAPKKHWETLKVLMNSELKNGNITRCEYGHLLWHFNGRKDINDMLNNGFEYVTNESGQRVLTATNCD